MSGFVAVVDLDGTTGRTARELSGLVACYADLREPAPGHPSPAQPGRPVGDDRARAVLWGPPGSPASGPAAGAAAVEDVAGWSVRVGVAHRLGAGGVGGGWPHPFGVGDLGSWDGQFCVVAHDRGVVRGGSSSGSGSGSSSGGAVTVVATDRFAAAPVYVVRGGGLLWVSSSALVLARHLGAGVCVGGVRDFLVSGYQFGAVTHWEGVRRLEPGSALVVEHGEGGSGAGRVSERVWWRPVVDRAVERLGVEAAADHLLEVAVETLRSRAGSGAGVAGAGGGTWLDLTGGYDSRLLAMVADRAGVAFTGNTRQTQQADDVMIARRLAERAGWPWQEVRLPQDWPSRLPSRLDAALAAADGRLPVLQLARVAWGHQQLARRMPGAGLLSAGGGEHLQYYAWNTELPFPGRGGVNVGRWVDMIGLKPADLSVLAAGSRGVTRERLVGSLSRWAAGFEGEPSTRVLDACYAYKSGGHFGAYRAADDLDVVAQLPYYFEPVFSAAFSVGHRVRGGFRLMRQMMWRLDPGLALLPTTRGGPAAPMRPGTAWRYAPYYAILGRKGWNKVSERLTGRPRWPFPVVRGWPEREANLGVVRHLHETGALDWDDLRVAPLLSDQGVARLRHSWPRHGEPRPATEDLPAVSSDMLGRVLTAELALAATDSRA